MTRLMLLDGLLRLRSVGLTLFIIQLYTSLHMHYSKPEDKDSFRDTLRLSI
jgi:hypothetical protein